MPDKITHELDSFENRCKALEVTLREIVKGMFIFGFMAFVIYGLVIAIFG